MKKRFFAITFSILASGGTLNAQITPTLNWAKTIGSIDTEDAFEITLDDNGDVIISGRYQGMTDFDLGPGVTSLTSATQCAYIAKYTSAGEFVWVVDFPSSFASYLAELKVDSANNIYACGSFYSDVDLQFGPGTNIITTPNYEALMVKLNPAGSLEYAYHTPVVTGSASFNQLEVNSTGEVFLVSYQYGNVDYDPGAGSMLIDNTSVGTNYYFVKLANTGTVSWVRDMSPEIYDMAVDSNDNLWLEGPFNNSSIDIAPGSPVTTLTGNGADNFVVKLDGNGDYQDHFVIENDDYLYTYNLVVDQSTQDILISGSYAGEANFEPATTNFILNATVTEELFVARYSKEGDCKWVKRIESNVSSYSILDNDLKTDLNGAIYIVGNMSGIYDADPGVGVSNINSSNADSYVIKWDSLGNYKWSYEIIEGGELNNVALTPDGNYLYLTGSFEFTSNVHPNGTAEIISAGNMDAFIVKWNNCDLDMTIFNNGSGMEANETSAGTTYQWYDGSGNAIPGATNSTYIPTANGDYQVLISKGDCSFFSNVYTVNSVGMEALTNQPEISIYPNPTNNVLVLSGITESSNLIITDLLGNKVLEENAVSGIVEIDLSHLPAGTYVIQLTTETSYIVEKITKN